MTRLARLLQELDFVTPTCIKTIEQSGQGNMGSNCEYGGIVREHLAVTA